MTTVPGKGVDKPCRAVHCAVLHCGLSCTSAQHCCAVHWLGNCGVVLVIAGRGLLVARLMQAPASSAVHFQPASPLPRLRTSCAPTVHQLHTSCTPTVHQLHTSCTPTAHPHISAPHLPHPHLHSLPQVDTVGTQAKDEFFITYHGEPLNTSMVQLVTNALQYYLSLAEVEKEESY